MFGFSGQKGSGKDTLANTCKIKLSFAEPLKTMCSSVFGDIFSDSDKNKTMSIKMNDNQITKLITEINKYEKVLSEQEIINNLSDKTFTSPREILQYIGTDIIRKYVNDKFWINMMENKLNKLDSEVDSVGISDARFPIERELLRKFGFHLILIKRDLINDSTSSHISENSFGFEEEYDYIIDNNSNIEDLYIAWEKYLSNYKR